MYANCKYNVGASGAAARGRFARERWPQPDSFPACRYTSMPLTEDIPVQALEEPGSTTLPSFESFYTHPNPIDMSLGTSGAACMKPKYEGLKALQEEDCKDYILPSLEEPEKDYADLLPVSDLFHKYLEKPQESDLSSWTHLHPQEWRPKQVLDFIYSLAEVTNGPSGLRGEKFQSINGGHLCNMSCDQLKQLEPQFGQTIYDQLQRLLKKSEFHPPSALDGPDSELPASPMDLSIVPTQQQPSFMKDLCSPVDESYLSDAFKDPVYLMSQLEDSKHHIFLNHHGYNSPVSPPPTPHILPPQSQPTDGTFVYDFDASDKFDDHHHDSGYTSSAGSSTSSQIDCLPEGVPTLVLQPEFQNDLDSTPPSSLPGYKASLHKKCGEGGLVTKRRPGRPKRDRLPSDSSSEGEKPVHKTRGRKPGQMSKGNHLWEFIRDLLKDPSHREIIKWEDPEDGVFRILKSTEVSHLWGKKKSNPKMNYEKLSRAMRFCRCEGYFGDVPKDGRFPKKLCFKFGLRAFGWK